MNYVFREAVLGYLTGCDAWLFSMRIGSMIENYPLQSLYTAMNLISSHDVPRALTVLADSPDFRSMSRIEQHDYVIPDEKLHLAKRRLVLAVALQMTLPGVPSVYYGDEAQMHGYADPFNRKPMDWENTENEISRQIRLFTRLRKNTPSLRTGFYKLLYTQGSVISFLRSTECGKDVFGKECDGEDIIVIINAAESCAHIDLSLEHLHVCAVKDSLSGEHISESGMVSLELAPLSYRLLSPERKKDICTKIQNIQ